MTALCLGLMSGTSMDAVDAALCTIGNDGALSLRATHTGTYSEPLRLQLLTLQASPQIPLSLAEWMGLDEAVARSFAATALELLAMAEIPSTAVQVLGSHGQTVFHDPAGVGSSLQLGNPSRIAALTGIATVGDFRRADIALGGQGAPLVPAFHHGLFSSVREPRAVLNLGGIANLTVLPGLEGAPVTGFDTGPANALMDDWIAESLGAPLDRDGSWARSGQVQAGLLEALLADPYFSTAPPKSTGRDHFNLAWVRSRYPDLARLAACDVQRSLAELTVRSVVEALGRHASGTRRLLVCGGGARNGFLMQQLAAQVPGVAVERTDDHGLDAQWVEAAAFAWLGWRTLNGLPGSLAAVTGARRAAVLGGLYRP